MPALLHWPEVRQNCGLLGIPVKDGLAAFKAAAMGGPTCGEGRGGGLRCEDHAWLSGLRWLCDRIAVRVLALHQVSLTRRRSRLRTARSFRTSASRSPEFAAFASWAAEWARRVKKAFGSSMALASDLEHLQFAALSLARSVPGETVGFVWKVPDQGVINAVFDLFDRDDNGTGWSERRVMATVSFCTSWTKCSAISERAAGRGLLRQSFFEASLT